MSKGKTKAQEMSSTISAESVLIRGESNWIQTLKRVCLVRLVCLVYPVSLVQPNKRDRPYRRDRPEYIGDSEVETPGILRESRSGHTVSVAIPWGLRTDSGNVS